jgi:mannose-6-phosphate isomerase-like protein (cupin superfamily)
MEDILKIINNNLLTHAHIPGIDHVTIAGSGDGLRHLSVWRQSMRAGSATPLHRHDCEEVVLCEAGRGVIDIGGKRYPFSANHTLVIPPDVEHQIFNVGYGPLETLAVFSRAPVEVTHPDGSSLKLPWRS